MLNDIKIGALRKFYLHKTENVKEALLDSVRAYDENKLEFGNVLNRNNLLYIYAFTRIIRSCNDMNIP